MFAKLFDSIYEGTLGEHWQGLVTFQQMLILCTPDGVIDKTPSYISRTTGIPLEIITAGVAFLEQPDPRSRSKAEEGRRIMRMDPDRDWGWFIVNHAEYRRKITAESKREADRTRIAGRRAAERQSRLFDGKSTDDTPRQDATSRDVSQGVALVAHSESDRDTEFLSVGNGEKNDSREAPRETPPPRAEIGTATGRAAKALRAAGVTHVNPSHPALLRLIDAGVTIEELADAATEAVKLGKAHLAYVCSVVEGRRRDAETAGAVPKGGKAVPVAGSGAHKPADLSERRSTQVPGEMPAFAKDLAVRLGIRTPREETTPPSNP